MGPPDDIPNRPNALLRKSRSTNTLRLPKRDEGSKPGYCESCRVKFDDFESHIRDRKHRKFANDDTNYLQLDFVLNRVQRRTRQQYKDQEDQDSTRNDEQQTCSEDYPMCSSPPFMFRGNEEEDMWDGDADADGDVLDV
ncbi:DBF zinc finger-domain-containing protein [Boletus reticuloceps]|nr:DBF zinc finger-domain-containing protein [Boletus reticuloceps]